MKLTRLDIPEVLLLEPKIFSDERGFFYESYSKRTLEELGITDTFVQENHILSIEKGVIRGIHFQKDPCAQAKLLRCTRGAVLDYAVDLRNGSPTYKKWVCVRLDSQNKQQIYIPKGFGHACISLEKETEIQYKVDEFYSPENDRSIAWNDPEIGIDWGTDNVILSDKDKNAPFLKDSDVNFNYIHK